MNEEQDYTPNWMIHRYICNQRQNHLLDEVQNVDGLSLVDNDIEQNEPSWLQIQSDENIPQNHESQDEINYKKQELKSTVPIKPKKNKKKKKKNKNKNKNKSIDYEVIEEGVDEQKETKNLTNYYIRHIVKEIKIILQNEKNEEIEDKLKQMLDGKYNCIQLGMILDVEMFRQIAINYIKRFNFFQDLLSSKKQINVKPIIKYAMKLEKISFKEQISFFKD